MVTRQSEIINIGRLTSVLPQEARIGTVAPDPNKYMRDSTMSSGETQMDISRMRIVDNLMDGVDSLAKQAWQRSTEEAYLRGAAKVGVVQSEEQLDENIVTRAWAVAGFRDTAGRLKAADNEASILANMKQGAKYREMSPEDFAQVLANKRAELAPQFEGMSAEARKSMFTQQLLSDRALLKAHNAEHYKFIMEQVEKGVTAFVKTPMTAMDAAKYQTDASGNPVATYVAATDSAFSAIHGGIIMNPNLDDATRGKFLKDVAAWALENDHQLLYQRIMGTDPDGVSVVTHADGTTGPMSKYMSFEDEAALAKQARESRIRTGIFSNNDYIQRRAQFEARLLDSSSPLPSIDEARAMAEEGKSRGVIRTQAELGSFWDTYYKKASQRKDLSVIAAAAANGDSQTLVSMGKSGKEGVAAWMQVQGSKMDQPTRMVALLNNGIRSGEGAFFEQMGAELDPMLQQVTARAEVSPQAAATLAQHMQLIDQAEAEGNPGLRVDVMRGLSSDSRQIMEMARYKMKNGVAPADAFAQVGEDWRRIKAMDGATRSALREGTAKDITKAVDELGDRGLLASAGSKVMSWVSASAEAKRTLRAPSSWLENEDRVQEFIGRTRLEVLTRADQIMSANPLMPAEAVMNTAVADVAANTVNTDGGPFILPQGTDKSRLFGVDRNIDNERIGIAVDALVKPRTDGGRIQWRLANGELQFTEYNKDGEIAQSGLLNPRVVGQKVQEQLDERARRFAETDGLGRTRTHRVAGVDSQVTFNGNNRAGAPTEWAFKLRDDLVTMEGVRNRVYKDGNGHETIGVGILLNHKERGAVRDVPQPTNGMYTQEQIDTSFRIKSDEAITTSMKLMQKNGFDNEATFMLLGSLAYQSGNNFANTPAYAPLMQALRSGNKEAAVSAFKQTPAYKASGESRRKWYLSMLNSAI